MSSDQPTFSGWASSINMWGERIQVRAAHPGRPLGITLNNLGNWSTLHEISADDAEQMAVALLRAVAVSRHQEGPTP